MDDDEPKDQPTDDSKPETDEQPSDESEQPTEESAGKSDDQSEQPTDDQPAASADDKPTDDQSAESADDKPADDQSAESADDKPADDQSAETSDDKPADDQPTDRSDDKPAARGGQPAGASEAKPAGDGGQTSQKPQESAASSGSKLFSFSLQPSEDIRARIVRCCEEALAGGQMGNKDRHDFYREFISCRQEKTSQAAEALTGVRTSCAMFVRAVRHWCGATPMGPYKPGTGMFLSLGNVSFAHPSFVKNNGTNTPNPGDAFYIATTQQSTDGHTGIFIKQLGPNEWRTAEGGGGGPPDGTLCRFTTRTISGTKFSNDGRTLWGWFDCTKTGLPNST